MSELRCGNHGGYDTEVKNMVCGLNGGKPCAGYNRHCGSYLHVNPSKKHKGEETCVP